MFAHGPIKPGAVLDHLAARVEHALHGAVDLQFGARSQPFSRQFGGPVAHPLGDVVTRDDEVFIGVILTTQDDVRVWVVSVPVVHRYPVQSRAKVGLHLRHQVPGIGAQVIELFGVFR